MQINSSATMFVVLILSLWATPSRATNASPAQEASPQPRCCAPLAVPNAPDAEVTFSAPVVPFDLDGDGQIELVAFPKNGAWLAVDLNKNGTIDDGRELVGQHTGGGTFPTGFEFLRDNVSLDLDFRAVTNTLLFWADRNFDGSSQPEELRAANEVLTGITLGYTTFDKKDQFGTLTWMRGQAFDPDEREWSVYVVFPATQ